MSARPRRILMRSQKGVLFENYFSTSFLTPVSEMSVHTGMYPTAHKTTNFDTVLPEDNDTRPIFQAEGYATSALLSSPEFEINPALRKSFSRGFERYEYLEEVQRAFPTREQVEEEIDTFSDKKFLVGGRRRRSLAVWSAGTECVCRRDDIAVFSKTNPWNGGAFFKIYMKVCSIRNRFLLKMPIFNM